MSGQPVLVFHAARAITYPTNDSSSNLLAVRFSTPVRISSVRIAPEGVASVDGIGVTYPLAWTGQLLFNVSDSTPVNALSSCEIELKDAEWEQEYPIDMPQGVTTRLMLLRSPAERLTISVFGYTGDTTENGSSPAPGVDLKARNQAKEDWSWLYNWAGGLTELLDLLSDETTPPQLQCALSSLEVLTEVDPTVLDRLLDHTSAVEYLISLPSYPPNPILQRLYAEPNYALHPNLRHYLPPSHPLGAMLTDDPVANREQAWRRISDGFGPLQILKDTWNIAGDDYLDTLKGEDRSNISRLLVLAQEQSALTRDMPQLNLTLDNLDLIAHSNPPAFVLHQLVDPTVRSTLIVRLHGSTRVLPFAPDQTRVVLQSLLALSTEIIDGQSVFIHTRDLAKPYIDHLNPSDPLRYPFDFANAAFGSPQHSWADDEDGRRLCRLDQATDPTTLSLDHPLSVKPSGIVHQATTQELLSIIAPELLASLQTAQIPPLGIPSLSQPNAESQANTWAGKVYTSHEFRRERDGTGGSGLGVGTGGMGRGAGVSRPASKHVDAFAIR